jgi:hypothetical protein
VENSVKINFALKIVQEMDTVITIIVIAIKDGSVQLVKKLLVLTIAVVMVYVLEENAIVNLVFQEIPAPKRVV